VPLGGETSPRLKRSPTRLRYSPSTGLTLRRAKGEGRAIADLFHVEQLSHRDGGRSDSTLSRIRRGSLGACRFRGVRLAAPMSFTGRTGLRPQQQSSPWSGRALLPVDVTTDP
jgi:hypothetical protein